MGNSLAQFLELGEHENTFHPLAVKHYQEFLDDISKDAPLGSITENDVKEILNGFDFKSYQYNLECLREWFEKCLLTNAESTLEVYPDSFPFWGTYGFKNLLLKVYQQKMLQQRLKEAKANAQCRAYQDSRRRYREWEEAKAEHGQWLNRVNKSLETFQTNLGKNTKPKFQKQAWLKSYHPKVWVKHLSGPTIDWFTTKTSILVATYESILEEALRDLVDVKFFYWDYHLPTVQYEAFSPPLVSVKGHPLKVKPRIPCLKWRLATHIISLTEFWQTEGTITDTRYGYDFQVQSSSEKLGTVYSGPEFWEYQDAFVTPLNLLAMLAWGGELPGVETVKIDKPWTIYTVEGFADEISLHEDFGRFIQDMTKKTSLEKTFLKHGMCDEQTALLVKEKLEKLKEPEAPSLVPGGLNISGNEVGDISMMVNALAGLGYKEVEAKKVAQYVCNKFPAETLTNKIKIALQSLGQ